MIGAYGPVVPEAQASTSVDVCDLCVILLSMSVPVVAAYCDYTVWGMPGMTIQNDNQADVCLPILRGSRWSHLRACPGLDPGMRNFL